MIELVVFLGNFGSEYAGNRHNAAWQLASELSFYPALRWQKKFNGLFSTLDMENTKRYFLLPHTYMNRSGISARAAADFYKIKPENILIVHDELELALGMVGIKFSGGLGGHNGLRSLKEQFGTADFWRFRIGIGRPEHSDISGWVLSDFTAEEEPVMEEVLKKSSETFDKLLLQDPGTFLPEWNKKKLIQSE